MTETQTVVRVESEMWREFKGQCLLHKTTPTKEIARFVAEQLQIWQKEEHTTDD